MKENKLAELSVSFAVDIMMSLKILKPKEEVLSIQGLSGTCICVNIYSQSILKH